MGDHSAKTQTVVATIQKYAKFIVALVGAIAATAAQVGISGTPTTTGEWATIGIYFLTALSVRQVPNKETKKNVV